MRLIAEIVFLIIISIAFITGFKFCFFGNLPGSGCHYFKLELHYQMTANDTDVQNNRTNDNE